MAKLLLSFFQEKRLVKFSAGPEKTKETQSETAENEDISRLNLLEDISGKSLTFGAEFGDKLAKTTNNEFELLGSEIRFKTTLDNGKTVARSFLIKGNTVFAKELVDAVNQGDSEKVRYLCYKYLYVVYLKKQGKNLKTKNEKIRESNSLMGKFIEDYEKRQTATQSLQPSTEETGETVQAEKPTATPSKSEAQLTREYEHMGVLASKEVADEVKKRYDKALENAIEDENTEMTIPGEVQNMDEEELKLAFKEMDGARGVENLLRQKKPNIDSNKAAKIFSEIFYAKWANNHFTFENVYDTLIENKILNYDKDFEDFAKEAKTNFTTRAEFDFVVELGEKIKDLRLNTQKIEAAKQTQEKQEYSYEDQVFIGQLSQTLNFSETQNSDFETFVGWLSGAKNAKSITMATMDGTVYMDEGYFRRHADPVSALNNILNTKGLYTIDKNGSKKLDQPAITSHLQKFIKEGFVAHKMAGKGPEKLTQNEALTESLILQKVDLNKGLSDEQKKYLQLGYLLDISEKIQGEEQEAKDSLKEVETENPEFVKELEEELKAKNVPPEIIAEIKNKMLLAVGTTMKFKDGKFEGFEGFGAGGSIDLGEGFTLSLGLAQKDFKSWPTLGMGLSLNLYKNGASMVNLSLGTSTSGAFGTMLQAETGSNYLSIGGNVGIGIDFKSGKLLLGGGVEMGFKLEGAMKENIAEAKEASPYAEAFEKFKTKDDPNEKYELLKTIPGLWATVSEIQDTYKLSNLDMVNIISMIEEEITARAVRDTSVWEAPLGIISKLGVQFVGPVPVPYIGFYLGSATVFAPNRSEISKLEAVRKARRIGEDKEMAEALSGAEVEEMVVFDKTVKEVTYTVDGKIAVITKSEKVDFSSVNDELEAYNEALKEVEMKIEQNQYGKFEVKVFNTQGKDLEIFIDPVLTDLALIKDGNRLCLEGNIKDMVITRERLMLPFKEDENSSNIRDVITIRSKKSLEGGRDRNWILGQTKGQYIEKKSGEGLKAMEIGTNKEGMWGQKNLVSEPGYLDNKGTTGRTFDFGEKRSPLQKGLSEEEKMARNSSSARAKEILEAKQEDLNIRENLLESIREKMKNKDFKQKVAETIDDTNGLLQLLKETDFEPALKGKELSEALSMVQDEYFIDRLEKYDYKKLDEKGRDRANKLIAERMRQATEKFFRGEIEKDFKSTLLKMGKTPEEAEQLSKSYTETVLLDTIYKLIGRLENEKGFNLMKEDAVSQIMAGSVFYSVTRDEKNRIVSTSTIAKSDQQTNYTMISGILKATEKKYPAGSEIGKVILEMLSPIETLTQNETPSYGEILASPMALKLLSFSAPLQDILGIRGYNRVLGYVAHPEQLKKIEDPLYKAGKSDLNKFIELLNEIRKAEVAGKPFTFTTDTGITYTIDVNTEIMAGSFSKCLNSSFLLTEEITIKGVRKENGKLVSAYSEQHDQVTSTMGKATMSVGAGVGVQMEEGNKQEGGKDASEGKGVKEVENKDANQGKGKPPTSDGDVIVPDHQDKGTTGLPV